MDINLLSRMLHELLLECDQVGLPGVGTFVAEMAPATFADKGYMLNPPFRKLVFHPNCLEDELLADFYARNNNIERSVADAYIKDFLVEMKKVLLDRKSLSLPGLGRLRVTRSNNIFFIPAEDLDIYPEGFGLEPISMKNHIEADDNVTISVQPHYYKTDPAQTPEPVPGPEVLPVPDSEPSSGLEPEPERTPGPELPLEPSSSPRQTPRPDVVPIKIPAANSNYEADSGFSWWIIPVLVFGLVVIAFCVFIIIAQINPEILYPILYSPEELEILNS